MISLRWLSSHEDHEAIEKFRRRHHLTTFGNGPLLSPKGSGKGGAEVVSSLCPSNLSEGNPMETEFVSEAECPVCSKGPPQEQARASS
jgi:hypothetical protein